MLYSKKGFTIVELVIVIAVIAILSAVLIPTFVGVVKKAKLSNDISFCASVNTNIAIISMDDNTKSPKDLFAELLSNGYSYDDFICSSEGNYYVYDQVNNMMAMVDKDFNLVYSTTQLSSQLWLIIEDETKVENYLKVDSIFGVLVITKSTILEFKKDNQLIYATETNLTQVISNATSVETVVKFTTTKTISFDIQVGELNALTLDLCGMTVEFNNARIINNGTLNLINGDLIFANNSQIYNDSKLLLNEVTITATGSNNEFYAVVNEGELKVKDCTIKTSGLCCMENKVEGKVEVDGGEYSADVFSTILNSGELKVLNGNFYRKANDLQVGTKGTVYAVINNLGASANLTITQGSFTNEYLTLPTERRTYVLNNEGGAIDIFDATLTNKCDNKDGGIIYTELNTASITINNATMTLKNQEAYYLSKAISTDKANIKIYCLTLNGSTKLNQANVTIQAPYCFYDYLVGATPKVVLTKVLPTTYGASVNNDFYLDVDMLTFDHFTPNAVIRINKAPKDLIVCLNRTHLDLQNSFTLVYQIDMAEIVSTTGDFILQKVDCTQNYTGAVKAYQYYSKITQESATFKVIYPSDQVAYYSSCEFVDALNVAKKIIFLKDLQLNSLVSTIWQSQNDLTIDLNGKTWTENGDVSYMLQCLNGDYTLTIIDGSVDGLGKMMFNSTQNGVAMFALYSSVVINNGTFVSNCNVFYLHGRDNGTQEEFDSYTYEIKGGTFVGGVFVGDFTYVGKLIITGGSFTFDPTQYLPAGYSANLDLEGVYLVKNNG